MNIIYLLIEIMVICGYTDCRKYGTYGYQERTVARALDKSLYCILHRQPGHIDLMGKTCSIIECDNKPLFNFSEFVKPTHCAIHKLDGQIDVQNRKCVRDGCNKRAKNKPNLTTNIYLCDRHYLDYNLFVIHQSRQEINQRDQLIEQIVNRQNQRIESRITNRNNQLFERHARS